MTGDYYDELHTAAHVSEARQCLLLWAHNQEEAERDGRPHWDNWRESRDRQADGITARAVHLGLEEATR